MLAQNQCAHPPWNKLSIQVSLVWYQVSVFDLLFLQQMGIGPTFLKEGTHQYK